MKYDESLEDFMDNFLHLCYEFSKEDVDWDFMNENFQYLVQISLEPYENESYMSLPNFLSRGAIKISKDEPTLLFVPCLPPFPSPYKVVSCTGSEVGKLENRTIDPLILSLFPPHGQDRI